MSSFIQNSPFLNNRPLSVTQAGKITEGKEHFKALSPSAMKADHVRFSGSLGHLLQLAAADPAQSGGTITRQNPIGVFQQSLENINFHIDIRKEPWGRFGFRQVANIVCNMLPFLSPWFEDAETERSLTNFLALPDVSVEAQSGNNRQTRISPAQVLAKTLHDTLQENQYIERAARNQNIPTRHLKEALIQANMLYQQIEENPAQNLLFASMAPSIQRVLQMQKSTGASSIRAVPTPFTTPPPLMAGTGITAANAFLLSGARALVPRRNTTSIQALGTPYGRAVLPINTAATMLPTSFHQLNRASVFSNGYRMHYKQSAREHFSPEGS